MVEIKETLGSDKDIIELRNKNQSRSLDRHNYPLFMQSNAKQSNQ